MILFTTLLLMLIILVVIAVIAVALGGSVFIIIFGDVIVCAFIIGWIMKKLINKRH